MPLISHDRPALEYAAVPSGRDLEVAVALAAPAGELEEISITGGNECVLAHHWDDEFRYDQNQRDRDENQASGHEELVYPFRMKRGKCEEKGHFLMESLHLSCPYHIISDVNSGLSQAAQEGWICRQLRPHFSVLPLFV